MIVDDEPDVVREIAAVLRRHGYEIPATAASGSAAVAEAGRCHPDLVLMDIVMDGDTDGIEAGRAIHQKYDIPIIYLTAFTDKYTLEKAKTSDPFGYIVKPFAERELCIMVEMALYRHRFEKALQDKERWFEAALTCIGDAVLATDMHSRVIFMNPLAEELTGWSRKEAEGRPISTLIRLQDEHTRTTISLPDLKTLIDSHKLFLEEQSGVLLNDRRDHIIPVGYRISLIKDDRGQLDGMVIALRDVTPHRKIEKQVLAAQKSEAIGKMAGSLAHQFNNLLAVVAGYAATMTDHLLPNTRIHADTLKILEAVKQARLLTKRLLGIARPTHPGDEVRIEPIALGGLVVNAKGLVERAFADRRIAIEIQRPESMPNVMGDHDRLSEVVIDLFMTAADAMPDGGTITVNAERKHIKKTDPKLNPHAQPGWYGVLTLKDTGRGFSAEVLENIFEIFFATHEPGKHVGFGLFAARNAILRFGGWIKASSKPWRGTTFTLFIPEGSCAIARQRQSAEKARSQQSLLVVDDNPETLAEMEQILTGAGYRVEKAAGSEDALTRIRDNNNHHDLYIVDVIMPGAGGRVVMHAILEHNPTALIVAICGFSREYTRSLLPPGAWRFLQKPFDRQQLLDIVAKSLAAEADSP